MPHEATSRHSFLLLVCMAQMPSPRREFPDPLLLFVCGRLPGNITLTRRAACRFELQAPTNKARAAPSWVAIDKRKSKGEDESCSKHCAQSDASSQQHLRPPVASNRQCDSETVREGAAVQYIKPTASISMTLQTSKPCSHSSDWPRVTRRCVSACVTS